MDELATDSCKYMDNYEVCEVFFKAGYQANKAEFTREEMESVVNWIRVNPNRSLNDALYWLRPLSLPNSVTIDGDKIEVNW